MTVLCPYCGQRAKYFATSEAFYGGRDYGPLWACIRCDAQVGCHPDGSPLGTLADKPTRLARMEFKRYFNPLWQYVELAYDDIGAPGTKGRQGAPAGKLRQIMRTRAYAWLAHHMNLSKDDCHGAMFGIDQCSAAVRIIIDLKPTPASIRAWAQARKPVATRKPSHELR